MSHQTVSHLGIPHDEELRKQEIQLPLNLKLIRLSRSHWTSPTLYVNKYLKRVRGKKNISHRLQETE